MADDGSGTFRDLLPTLRRDRGLVRKARLELARLAAREPKSRTSTNSATFAGGNVATEYISGLVAVGPATTSRNDRRQRSRLPRKHQDREERRTTWLSSQSPLLD